MSKICIITDSNSGISQKESLSLGVKVIPMPFTIGGKEYFEDITLTQEEFYEKLKSGADIFTSQPTPQVVMDLWNETLKEYDEIIHMPMSSGLSSSYQTARMLAEEEEYEGKVFVVNNQRISVTLRQAVYDALFMIEKGHNAKEIADYLENSKFDSTIYITLDTLKYLKKGGRITPAAAAIGTLLKIKPVLQIQGEKLDAFSKARTMGIAKNTMINQLKEDVFGRISENGKYPYGVCVAHTQNEEAALELVEELKAIFPDSEEIIMNPLSLSVSCHIGPGALAVAASRILK